MKIVLLVPDLHAGAELVLNKILAEDDINVVGIVRSDISVFSKSYWKYIRFGIERSGFFYGILIGILAYLHIVYLYLARLVIRKSPKWLTLDELIEKHQIPVCSTQKINSKETIDQVKSWKPDVMVSLYFNQILKKKIISVPKVATLNVHPGLLPKYRGMWPEFWKLLNDESHAGVSIHHLIEKIDAGDVIAQDSFPIEKDDTKFSLALKTAQRGSLLLISVLKKMKQGICMTPLVLKGKANYYSLPNKESFDKFHAKGKKLFSPLKVWRQMRKLA